LRALERAPAEPQVLDILRQVQLAEASALQRFRDGKAEAIRDLERSMSGRKVAGTYSASGTRRAFESQG
jgi:hypothetical protein